MEKRLKIIQMLPGLDSGGVERGTLEIGAYLASRNHESIVISAGGRMVGQLESQGSRHIRVQVAAKSPLTLYSIIKFCRILKDEKPDILHLRSRVPAWVAFFALKMLRPEDRPAVVTTFHGFHSVNPYSAIMASGSVVIAVSKAVYRHVNDCYGSGKHIKIIPRGVDSSVFSPDAADSEKAMSLGKKWGIKPEIPVVMLPARFTRLKGHELFIDALGKIKSLSWQAVFIGDHTENPSYTAYLEKRTKSLGIAERVVFGGYSSDMPSALSVADIAVSASIRPESFGRTAVEAMAMAVPVVVPSSGGFAETVSDGITGRMFKSGDADSLARCLADMLCSEALRKEMGTAARARVMKYFTLDRMCRKTEEAYFEALGFLAEKF